MPSCTASVPGALLAVMKIPRFAATLKVGEIRAVDVARDEVYKEGALFDSTASWSLLISSLRHNPGIPLTRAGGLCVFLQWLEFDGIDSLKQRRYRLDEVRLITVHSLVRGGEVEQVRRRESTQWAQWAWPEKRPLST